MATERSVGDTELSTGTGADDLPDQGGPARRRGKAGEQGGDSAPLGPPAEIQSDRIGPSDPDRPSKS